MIRRFGGLTCLVVIGSLSPLVGQERPSVSLRGIFALPVGGYGQDLGNNPRVTRRDGFDVGSGASFAGQGFGASAELSFPVGPPGLSWISSLTILINGSDDDRLTERFQSLVGEQEIVQFDNGSWMQAPIMSGFRYGLAFADQVEIYGMLQGGLSLIHAATRRASVAEVTVDKRTYDLTRQFGYGVGGGILINRTFDLGVRFFDFGEPAFDGTRSLDRAYFNNAFQIIGEDVILGEERPVSVLLLSVGYHF